MIAFFLIHFMKKKTAKKPKVPKQPEVKPVMVNAAALQAALDSVSDQNVDRINFHLKTVERVTGAILEEDITYCLNLDKRMRNKIIADLKK